LLHKRANPILPPYIHPSNHPHPVGGKIKDFVFIKTLFLRTKKISLQTKRCNYKTNSSESIKRHQYADV
jgi:hypothetical protein